LGSRKRTSAPLIWVVSRYQLAAERADLQRIAVGEVSEVNLAPNLSGANELLVEALPMDGNALK
jgi:hypothetical protein